MKRLYLLTLFLASAAAATAPAASAGRHPSHGLRAGLASGRLDGSYGDTFARERLAGFAGGAFATIRLGGVLSLQPELGWATKGGQSDLVVTITSSGDPPSSLSMPMHVAVTLHYVEIPVLLRADLPSWGAARPYALGGPYAAYRVGGHVETESGQSQTALGRRIRMARIFEDLSSTSSADRWERFDWGLATGLGLAIGSGRPQVLLEARHSWGFVNAFPEPDFGTARNHAFTFSVGVALH